MKLSTGRTRAELIASFAYGISQADRDKDASSGAAMPDGGYPIETCEGENSVDSAISAVGRGAGSHDAIRKHIIIRAKSLGCSAKIPDDWNDDGSMKTSAKLAAPPPPAAKTPPPVDKSPVEPEKPAADPDTADAAVTEAITTIKAAVDKAIEAQKADPDQTDPKDEKVVSTLQQISDQVGQLIQDQAADAAQPADKDAPAVTAAGAVPPPAGGKAATVPADQPKTNPVADNGDVDSDAKCANPDCQHLASSHNDTPDGKNTGGCVMANCECQGMQVEAQPNTGSGDASGPDTGQAPADDGVKLAIPGAVPGAAPVDDAAGDSDLNKPPVIPGGENTGPQFFGVLVIEGQPTGDGREIAPEALTWRDPPLPLMLLRTETHDPEGFDMNDPAVICGRIDTITRVAGESGTQLINFGGYFLANDDGAYAADLTEAMGRLGVSADIAVEDTDMQVGDVDEVGFPIEMTMTLTKGTVMGGTACPFPAFAGCYIVLGDGTEAPEAHAIPQTADSPVVPDKPPAVVAAGGQLLHLMTYEQCEQCDQDLELVASGAPTRPPKSWFENPNFTVGDGRLMEILDRRGQRVVGGKYACPLTVTDDGRVFGHIAPWGVCHTGHTGQCILAPKSRVDYAHFKRGQHVVTAEGEQIRVGVITCDTGHASTRGISAAAAMAHYDNTALAAADVNIGDDEHGIWVAGALRPDATEEQIRKLRAASISGDWRKLGGSLELVAALAVNQPGFPLAVVASGQHETLVAAGATVMDRLKHPTTPDGDDTPAWARALLPLAAERSKLRIAGNQARARLRLVK